MVKTISEIDGDTCVHYENGQSVMLIRKTEYKYQVRTHNTRHVIPLTVMSKVLIADTFVDAINIVREYVQSKAKSIYNKRIICENNNQ